GGSADVGIYSLWPVFTAPNVGPPLSASAWSTHTCNTVDHVANPMVNDFSFPTASVIQFQYAARPDWPALDLFWYDGGVQPRIPELDSDPAPVGPGGMLWVGDKGKILTGGRGAPQLITAKGVEPLWTDPPPTRPAGGARPSAPANVWVPAFKGGETSPRNFLTAGPISETVCL